MENYIGWQCPICKNVWAPFVKKCACQTIPPNETLDDDKTFCRMLIESTGTATPYQSVSNVCFECDSYQKRKIGRCLRGDIVNPGYAHCPLYTKRREY